jgi:radical SAM enzyme (TIGR01210 family)
VSTQAQTETQEPISILTSEATQLIDSLEELPSVSTEWDTWIRRTRPDFNQFRAALSVELPSHQLMEFEPIGAGRLLKTLTVFLTNRECPWHCLMCDLWKETTLKSVPSGSIPRQLRHALNHREASDARHLKLYNAGSFFDAGAIPVSDYGTVASQCRRFNRVIVESHPRLIGKRTILFQELLGSVELEVAMGLETVHPDVLSRLNKGMNLDDFRRATGQLRGRGVRTRAFILVKPPFLTNESEALEWACRTIDFAWAAGVDVVSLIPTRAGNGAMEELARRGLFAPPQWSTVEGAFRHGVESGKGLVLMDLWNLSPNVASDSDKFLFRRLSEMNRLQSWVAP